MTSGVVPRTGSPALARGFETRVVPLRFVSATEMEKILKPYARQGAIVSADGSRNMITIAGTRAELENYLRTIQVFDVDWMSSMSVGVYPLQSGKASTVVQDLERVFGEQGKAPTAGMFRFMPLDSSQFGHGHHQPAEVPGRHPAMDRPHRRRQRRWPAVLLRAQVHQGARPGRSPVRGLRRRPQQWRFALDDARASTPPKSAMRGVDDKSSTSSASVANGLGDGGNLPNSRNGNGRVTLKVDGSEVGVSAVEDTNSLLVRANSAAVEIDPRGHRPARRDADAGAHRGAGGQRVPEGRAAIRRQLVLRQRA